MAAPTASVVIAAHNEARVIGRLLAGLVDVPSLEIIVVCNGCTDRTEDVVRTYAPTATLISVPVPSKSLAQRTGDQTTTTFPRLYLDADVIIDADSVCLLAASFDDPNVLASGPRRVLTTAGASRWVKAYYRVWERLPHVRHGLFGRGVVAVNKAGYERIRALPSVMSDDLVMSESFSPSERRVVSSAVVEITTPKTIADLVRRRVRIVAGTAQATRAGLRGQSASTSLCDLFFLCRDDWRLAPSMSIFLATTATARLLAQRQIARRDFTTWGRDESSRL